MITGSQAKRLLLLRNTIRWIAAVGVFSGCATATQTGSPTPDSTLRRGGSTSALRGERYAVTDSMAQFASISSVTFDSAKSREQPNCRAPLTGLLHSVRDSRRWHVAWPRVLAHIAQLRVEEDSGEKNHVLQPVTMTASGDTVKASIASIKGTEVMSEAESLEALRCGRVIARIISNGDHPATEIKEGTNYLVIALTQPMTAANPQWIFVIINRSKNYRASLDKFEYTPHYSYDTPPLSAVGSAIRGAMPQKALSVKATDCLARGFKACFIDGVHPVAPQRSPGGASDGLGNSGRVRFQIQSQPWVPCPLYGCCCGGDACHDS